MDTDATRYLGQYANAFQGARAQVKPTLETRPEPHIIGEEYLRNLVRAEAEKVIQAVIPVIAKSVKEGIEANLHASFSNVLQQVGALGTEQERFKVLLTQVQRQVFGGKNMPRFNLEII